MQSGIELPHDALVLHDIRGQFLAERVRLARQLQLGCVREVGHAVLDCAGLAPLAEALHERLILGEVIAPQARVFDTEALEGRGMAQQGDEPRIRAVEVGEKKDRPFVGEQGTCDMVGIDPTRQHDHNRRFGVDLREHRGALALLRHEAMLALGVVSRQGFRRVAQFLECRLHGAQCLRLLGPRFDACRFPEISVSDQVDLLILLNHHAHPSSFRPITHGQPVRHRPSGPVRIDKTYIRIARPRTKVSQKGTEDESKLLGGRGCQLRRASSHLK